MANLKIRVDDIGGRTVSNFRVSASDEVVFINRSNRPLTVEINRGGPVGSQNALCINGIPQPVFEVNPGQGRSLRINGDYNAETFKYTATIAGTVPEDPIIIIER